MPTAINTPNTPSSSSSSSSSSSTSTSLGVSNQGTPSNPRTPVQNTSARSTVSQTPQPRISRYGNPAYLASPDSMSGRTPGRSLYGNRNLSLLSRPATPPGSPLSSPLQPPSSKNTSDFQETPQESFENDDGTSTEQVGSDQTQQQQQQQLRAADWILHTIFCILWTFEWLGYKLAFLDLQCLAGARRLFNSISNNYRVDKILFFTTCFAIMFSIAVVVASTKQPTILSTEQFDATIKQEIESRLTVLKNLLKSELAKEKGVSHKELESSFRQFSSHIDDVINSKYELQEEKITEKAAEVAGAYLRSLEEKTNTMERINDDVSAKYTEFNQALTFLQTFQREVQELKTLMKSPLVTVEQFETALNDQRNELIEREREEIKSLRQFVKQHFITTTKLTTELDLFKSQQDTSISKILESKLAQAPSSDIKEATVRAWVLEELSSQSGSLNKETRDLIHSVIQEEIRQSIHKVQPSVESIEQITKEVLERTAIDVIERYASSYRHNEKASVSEETIQQLIDEAFSKYAPSKTTYTSSSGGSFDETRVIQIVEEALERFAADKIGKPDFALRTAGASIVESRTSESFGQSLWSIFPIPFTRRVVTQHPTVILEPDVTIGRCWAFAGGKGHVTVALSEPVAPTAFTIDHISSSVAHVRGLASAPREFNVYGLHNATDTGVKLASGTYDTTRNRSTQTFHVQKPSSTKFPLITLEVLSNYGHHYTCLYRFRVHSNV